MKPGRFPFAENNTFVAGPDIGSNTKVESPTVNKEDGLYRGYRPAADVLNYQLHRAAKVQHFLARMQAMNAKTIDVFADGAAAYTTAAVSTHGIGDTAIATGDPENYIHTVIRNSAGTLDEIRTDHNGSSLRTTLGAIALGVPNSFDFDHENNKTDHHRIFVWNNGAATDLVYYTTALVPNYALCALGAPTYYWSSVCCDQNTGSVKWLIGSEAMGGGPTSYIYSSSDGITFANEVGWPGATVVEDIRFIGHTRHYANNLYYGDPGNASWLVLTASYGYYSSDGSTFTGSNGTGLHGLTIGNLHPKSAAYSRSYGRWVIPCPSNVAGDVYYSDDNGATWQTFSAVIPEVGSVSQFFITSDFDGTLIATWTSSGPQYIVSVDGGETWSNPISIYNAQLAAHAISYKPIGVFDDSITAVENSRSAEYFGFIAGDIAVGPPDELEFSRTLIY